MQNSLTTTFAWVHCSGFGVHMIMILYCMFLIKNSDSQEMGDSDSSGTHGVFSVSDCTSNFKSSALSNDQVASCIHKQPWSVISRKYAHR